MIKKAIDTPEKGTSTLLLGAGVGTYGTVNFTLAGFVCPACIVLTPVLLGYGAYQRYKFNRLMKDDHAEQTLQDHTPPTG
jgi:hypothetical protein